MTEKCAWYCPNYIACRDALAINSAQRQTLEQERAHLEGMVEPGSADAPDEELQRQLAVQEMRLVGNLAVSDQIEAASAQIEGQFDSCSGPDLGVLYRFMFVLGHRSSRAAKWMPRVAEEERQQLYREYTAMLSKHGRCTSRTAKQAAVGLPRLRYEP